MTILNTIIRTRLIALRKKIFRSDIKNFEDLYNFFDIIGTAGQAGAVDEDSFMQAFEEVPKKVTIFNGRTVADELNKIRETLAKTSNDWKVRIDALQMMRSLLIAGADQHDEMFPRRPLSLVAAPREIGCVRSSAVLPEHDPPKSMQRV